jgi:hypothetical protein
MTVTPCLPHNYYTTFVSVYLATLSRLFRSSTVEEEMIVNEELRGVWKKRLCLIWNLAALLSGQ